MATKRDIADFNVSELMRQMQGLKTKSSKENRWKAMLPELFSGLVSVYDKYQEDKLLETIDQKNFDNAIELGKLRADTAKLSKTYKDTAPLHDALLRAGVSFQTNIDDESNFRMAEKVLGDNAWDTVSAEFKAFPGIDNRERFQNFREFKKNASMWVNPSNFTQKDLEAIENRYRGIIKDKFEYVKTGQEFDYDKFESYANQLESMEIDPDMVDSGLLSKLSGRLRRRIQTRDRTIDNYRNTYLSAPAQSARKSLNALKSRQTGDNYVDEVKAISSPVLSALPENFLEEFNSFPGFVRDRVADSVELDIARKGENVTSNDIFQAFERSLYLVTSPTEAMKYYRKYIARENELLRQTKPSNYEEQIQANTDSLKEFAKIQNSVDTEERARGYIKLNGFIKNLKNKLEEDNYENPAARTNDKRLLRLYNGALYRGMYDYEEKDLSYITNNLHRADVENLITNFQTENPGKMFTSFDAAKILNENPGYSQEVKDGLVLRSYTVQNQPVITSAEGIDLRSQFNAGLEKYIESGQETNSDTEDKIEVLMKATDNLNAGAKLKFIHMIGQLSNYTKHAHSLGLQNPLGINRPFEKDELVELIPQLLFKQEEGNNVFITDTEDKFILNEASITFDNLSIAFRNALEENGDSNAQDNIDLKSGKFVVTEDTLQRANEKLKETDLSMDEVQQLRLINKNVATLSQDGENNWHKFTLLDTKENRDKILRNEIGDSPDTMLGPLLPSLRAQAAQREITRLEDAKRRVESLGPEFTSAVARGKEIDEELENAQPIEEAAARTLAGLVKTPDGKDSQLFKDSVENLRKIMSKEKLELAIEMWETIVTPSRG